MMSGRSARDGGQDLVEELKRIERERERLLAEKAKLEERAKELEKKAKEQEKEEKFRHHVEAEKRRLEAEKAELEKLRERVSEAQPALPAPEQEKPSHRAEPQRLAEVVELAAQHQKRQEQGAGGPTHKFAIIKRYYGIGEFYVSKGEGAGVVSKTKKFIRFGG